MAGAGYKLFNTGDVLTAAQVNTYLQEQTVMVFASSAARTTALSGVLAEGMMSYLQDTNSVEVYNGSAWTAVGGGGGDVTEVQAGTGISVASGTGPIPVVTNTMATEITAAGDIIVGTGSGTFDNLPIGTTGQILTADTTVSPYKVKWATAAGGGGKVLQVVQGTTTTAATSTTTTWADTNLSASITPSSATSKVLILVSQPLQITRNADGLGGALRLLRGSTYIFGEPSASAPYLNGYLSVGGATAVNFRSQVAMTYLDSPSTTSSTTYKTQFAIESTANSGTARVQESSITASIILMEIGA